VSAASRRAACPQCGEPAELGKDNPWRPFCSRRCKLIDLGDWLEERHVIPGEPVDGGSGEPGSGSDSLH